MLTLRVRPRKTSLVTTQKNSRNCHLDGNYNDWTELKQIHAMKLTDTFRTIHPKLHGFTEDTKINFMRWNTKFIHKQFKFYTTLVKRL